MRIRALGALNQQNSFNLNALRLTIEKDKDSSKFPAGFRADIAYGTDAAKLNGGVLAAGAATAATSENAVSIEQAYVDFGIPLGNGIDAKFGKMSSLLGYEVINSRANWQFSRSDAFRLLPLAQEGLTLGYQWNDYFNSTVGLINGYDHSALFNNTAAGGASGASNLNTSLSFVGRMDIAAYKSKYGDVSGYLAGYYGNDNSNATALDNSTSLSVLDVGVTWQKAFGYKHLTLASEFVERIDSGITTGAAAAASSSASADAFSLYGAWAWNKQYTTSGRFSHTFYNQSNNAALSTQSLSPFASQFTGGLAQNSNNTVSSFTLTQAVNVWKDTLMRLEWRHDWTDIGSDVGTGFSGTSGNSLDARQSQDTIAVNIVYSF